MDTYSIALECRNCFQKTELKIPKGIPSDQFLKDHSSESHICDVCGCHVFPNGLLLVIWDHRDSAWRA